MLDAKITEQLKQYLGYLKRPIDIDVWLDEGDASSDTVKKSAELKQLAEALNALSDKITLTYPSEGGTHKPGMLIRNPENGSEIRFAGVPMGHEFTSLVLALLHSGGHDTKQADDVIKQVEGLAGEYNFEVFISLSCQTCPDVVQALNTMAALNPNVKTNIIDGAVFSEEAEARGVMAVPMIFLNGEEFSQGRQTIDQLLAKLDSGAEERQAEEIAKKEAFDMLIVGGGPAGAAAAVYSARKGLRTGIVADKFGGQVLDTAGIENFISVSKTEGPKLAMQLEQHVNDYDVDVMHNQLAASINTGNGIEVTLQSGATLSSQSVVIATGASWRKLNVPGEDQYMGKGVAYCPHCDGPLFKGKRVAVIGGGNSGIEAAIDLANIVGHVTVLEFDTKLRADDVLIRRANSLDNITIITNAATTEVIGDGKKVNGLVYTDRATDESKTVELEGIFVQIGLLPNTGWLKDSDVELTQYGEIITGKHNETSMPGVFAAGDATDVPYKQIIIAMGQGANAALGAFDYMIRSEVPAADKAAA